MAFLFFCLAKIFIYKIFFRYGNDYKEEKAFEYIRRGDAYKKEKYFS